VRSGIIIVVALGLAAGAGWVWLNNAPGAATQSHEEISSEDHERLREVLRDEGTQ
jgi:hypothetical protein